MIEFKRSNYGGNNNFEEIDVQLAENNGIENNSTSNEYEEKRKELEKTKITKQTWSIREIYQKTKEENLIVDTDYQRNVIWDKKKQSAFIESLFMEIIVPPIYVVELPEEDILSGNKYEVVDGKQRLTAIQDFMKNKLSLDKNSLEYFPDMFGNKNFSEVKEISSDKINQLLSYVLDIYVITANSPDATKYDIFARLNKGSEPLKVNEIRRAIYCSPLTKLITTFVNERVTVNPENDIQKQYNEIFTKNDIKRFDDFGRFYRSIAFFYKNNLEECIVENYNSRPRDMINNVLLDFQRNPIKIDENKIELILEKTIELMVDFKNVSNSAYLIDSCINYAVIDYSKLKSKINIICQDTTILSTFNQSSSTTSLVNKRLSRVIEIMEANS